MRQPLRTFSDTSRMEELQHQPQSMRSEPSNGKARDLEPEPEVRVRYVVSVGCLIHPENAQHGAKNVTNVAIKIILALNVGPNSQEEGDRRSHSTSRGCKGKGKCQQSRSRSNQVTKSAYSMESASFQDHPDLHGEKTDNLHGGKCRPPGTERRPPWNPKWYPIP